MFLPISACQYASKIKHNLKSLILEKAQHPLKQILRNM